MTLAGMATTFACRLEATMASVRSITQRGA